MDGSKVNLEKIEHSEKTSCLALTAKCYWLEIDLGILTKGVAKSSGTKLKKIM